MDGEHFFAQSQGTPTLTKLLPPKHNDATKYEIKTELQHTPLKSFTQKLAQRKSTQNSVLFVRDALIDRVVADLLLNDVLGKSEELPNSKVARAALTSNLHQDTAAQHQAYLSLLTRVMTQLLAEEIAAPVVAMHNHRLQLKDNIEAKSVSYHLSKNTTLADEPKKEIDQVLGIEQFRCLGELLEEAA